MMIEKQAKFAQIIAKFILIAAERGYLFTFGEAWRAPFVAEHYARSGKGIKNSLHIHRLAIDLNAFHDGAYLDASQSWHIMHLEELGRIWESLDAEARWGGRFENKDYNHYSFEHNGVK